MERGWLQMSTNSACSRFALAALLSLCLIAPTAAQAAGAPAAVTVRAEGVSETKLPPTEVTTDATPVVKDGNSEHSCSGFSAAGALDLATGGEWAGKWFSGLGYSVETIKGETFSFSQKYYWSFWLNYKLATSGICETELSSGDTVLFLPECFSETAGECPETPPAPLSIEAPSTANAGETVDVTVKQYKADGTSTPAIGVEVSDEANKVATDAQGHASLKLVGAGQHVLRVAPTAGSSQVRTETTVCVHEGDDGTCGTTRPKTGGPSPSPGSTGNPGPTPVDTVQVKAAQLVFGHVYSRRHAPRVLAGTVLAGSAVDSISISLRRSWRRRCSVFSGVRQRFVKARCGYARFFEIPVSGPRFSYLLPFKLPRGRYVYEVKATDAAGRASVLRRGSSRMVFYVK